jgi:predicted MPP superfamily phosphohydrolase
VIGRRRVLKTLGAVAAAGVGTAAWGFGAEPALRLRVQRYHLSPVNWTGGGLRIACLADFHLGAPYVGLDRLARIVARANTLDADLIVLLGDFAAGHRFVSTPVRIADAAPILARLRAPLGRYANGSLM